MGKPERTVQLMAARGEIPSAIKWGRGYSFDEPTVRAWIKREEQRQWQESGKRQKECNGAATFSGRNFKSKAVRSVNRYGLTIRELLKSG